MEEGVEGVWVIVEVIRLRMVLLLVVYGLGFRYLGVCCWEVVW